MARRLEAARVTSTPEGAPFAPAGAIVGGSVAEVADADLGVSVGRLAVAETGSVLLGSNHPHAPLVPMLARTHVVVVKAGAPVPPLREAAPPIPSLTPPGPDPLR